MAALLPFVGALGALLKRVIDYFGAQAQLERRKLADARQEALQEVEAERLKATFGRVEAEPQKAPADLLDTLNRQFGEKK